MRWEYFAPEPKLAVTDGESTWLYLPEENEVQHGVFDEEGGGAAAMLLAGRLRLDRDFSIRRLTSPDQPPEPSQPGVFELTPRKATQEFDKLILSAEPDTLLIHRIVLIDPLGGRMAFEFFDLEENPDLSEHEFEFEPPEGVDVVDMR